MTRFFAAFFSERRWPYYFLGLVLALDLCVHGVVQARVSGFLVGWTLSYFGSLWWSRNHHLRLLPWRIASVVLVGYILIVLFAPDVISFCTFGVLCGAVEATTRYLAKEEKRREGGPTA